MKSKVPLLLVVFSLIFGTVSVARADDAVPTRADRVATIQAKYNPIFDSEYARLLVVKSKIGNDATTMASFTKIMDDFLNVRRTIDQNLADPTSDLDTVAGYAEEETGQFADTLRLMEKQVNTPKASPTPSAKVTPKKVVKKTTITCLKGKTVKKVTAVNPICPKGYIKKK